jgi:hypothetical protein
MKGIGPVEVGLVPDVLVRIGIRQLLRRRLRDLALDDREAADSMQREFRAARRASPIVETTS